MKKERVVYLYGKYIKDELNAQEQLEWYDLGLDLDNDQVFQELVDGFWNSKNEDLPGMNVVKVSRVKAYILAQPQPVLKEDKVFFKRLWPKIAVAAGIACMVVGAYFFRSTFIKTDKDNTDMVAADIAPGKNGATLTLADGKKIFINDMSAGNIALQSGVRISKTADEQIIYEITGDNSGKIEYNTLTTTRGEQTKVRLPDGSLVFLNAASSLKFPTSFAKLKERSVEISGEGYFEIAKDKAHPFIVKNEKQQVEVLGTHFNINAYKDEPSVKTTLLEGSVKISTDQNTKVLNPGEQAVNSNEKLSIGKVDIDKAVAWKNSKFVFDDENIESVMRKLSRWYNVEVVYQDNVADRTFTGSISRYDKISKILDKITYIEAVHFKVEGRRITVMK